MFITSLNRV